MNIHDLIAALEDLADAHPDVDVRLAMQPSWPFEYSIADVVSVDLEDPDGDGEEEITVVYLVEGRQLNYLGSEVKDALGW